MSLLVSSQLLVSGLIRILLSLQLQFIQNNLPVLVAVLVVEHVLDDDTGVHPRPQTPLQLAHLNHDEGGELETKARSEMSFKKQLDPCSYEW